MSTQVDVERIEEIPTGDDDAVWHIGRFRSDTHALCGHRFRDGPWVPMDEVPAEQSCKACDAIYEAL